MRDDQAPSGREAILELRGVHKRFGAIHANRDVSLAAAPGEVRGIVGENGAGKTTLMSIASGLHRPDAGEILVDGRAREFRSPMDAIAVGINMVHQQFMLVERLTVAENIVLGDRGRGLWRATRRVAEEVRRLGERYGMPVDPGATVAELSPSQRQQTEILAALYRRSRVLILDEPTSVLAPAEIGGLFDTVRQLAGSGQAVIFISHKLREVLAVCDRISVMRGGELLATLERAEADAGALAELMVGRRLAEAADGGARGSPKPGDPLLALRGVAVPSAGQPVEDVDLDVRGGEILGIAGVDGNGQVELVEAIAGLRALSAGEIRLDGRDVGGLGAGQRAELGVGHVPEEPRQRALLLPLSVAWNIGLRHYRDGGRWMVDFARLRQEAEAAIERFDIRGATPSTPVGQLSGGNQQKVVLARELGLSPRLLLVVNPTAGLDVGATTFIHASLRDARDRGAGVVLVSTDLDEIEALSDRIAVMYGGRIAGVVEPGEGARGRVGLLMGGVTAEAAAGRHEHVA